MFNETSTFILELLRCGRPDGIEDHLDWQGMSAEDRKAWTERCQAVRATIVP